MNYLFYILFFFILLGCNKNDSNEYFIISEEKLRDKIKGAWASQTIGVTFGGPTEFRYLKKIIPDSIEILWDDSTLYKMMKNTPGLYDDIYMDLTFVEVMEKEGIDAPASSHAKAYANAKYWLWHANQQGRYNILNGIMPPESGHWLNNPHADDIDFQIEADFAGIMTPGMPNTALEICDKVGHIMNYGDGYYGGVFVAGMYSHAFVENDIPTIINKSLNMIPKESTFYQCINDVINWHKEYPENWKKNWELIEKKWGEDIGCPDGAHEDFNIDAKINAAYVVLGLLYGKENFRNTLEVSTRAGQDSDCNPATAMAILGTLKGYSKIPEFWTKGLKSIEDIDFQFTNTSLNKVYEISLKHAKELIIKNGGKVDNENIKIKVQNAITAPMEQSFPDYELGEKMIINRNIGFEDNQELSLEFEGIGVVLKGRVRNKNFDNKYALISNEETLNNYNLEIEYSIDDKISKTMQTPIYFIERAHELFFKYDLDPGKHTLKMKIKNPNEDVRLDITNLITYRKKSI